VLALSNYEYSLFQLLLFILLNYTEMLIQQTSHSWYWKRVSLFCILVTQTVLGTFIAKLIIFIVVEIFFSTTNYFHSANICVYICIYLYTHGGSGKLKSSGMLCYIDW